MPLRRDQRGSPGVMSGSKRSMRRAERSVARELGEGQRPVPGADFRVDDAAGFLVRTATKCSATRLPTSGGEVPAGQLEKSLDCATLGRAAARIIVPAASRGMRARQCIVHRLPIPLYRFSQFCNLEECRFPVFFCSKTPPAATRCGWCCAVCRRSRARPSASKARTPWAAGAARCMPGRLCGSAAWRFDCSRAEFPRIFVHELFHFIWAEAGQPGAPLLRASGEGGWQAGARASWAGRRSGENAPLAAGDVQSRSRRWREYCCESFCDTAAWLYSGARRHGEFTLAARLPRPPPRLVRPKDRVRTIVDIIGSGKGICVRTAPLVRSGSRASGRVFHAGLLFRAALGEEPRRSSRTRTATRPRILR